MARARNIKPALFKNELLGVADPLLTLLFQSLWTLADKEGRLEDRPLRIKAETFPYREGLDVNGYLTELQRLGFIVRYSVDGLELIQVINFKKHQTPHNTEKPSELPAYAGNNQLNQSSESVTVKPPLKNGEIPAPLPPDSLIPDSLNLIPDSLSTPAGAGDLVVSPTPIETITPKNKTTGLIKTTVVGEKENLLFDEFWRNYPKKVGKGAALKAWGKKVDRPVETLAVILAALQWQTMSDQWRKDGGQFIPNPETYLNQTRWLDEAQAQAPPSMTPVGQRAMQVAKRWAEKDMEAVNETQ